MGFPERLRKLREKKKLNQTQYGKLFNLSKQAISSYENGGSRPSHETLIKMAEFFEVSIDYLFGLTGDPTPPQSKKQEKPNFEEYVLSAPALGKALERIAELDDRYGMDEPTFADLSQKVYKKFRLSNAKGADKAAGGIKMPGTGALDD